MGQEPKGADRVVALKPGRGHGLERLIFLATAVMLLPLAIYTAYLAQMAAHEGDKFRQAPPLPATGRINGVFYKVTGPATGDLLDPSDYPEVKGALSLRVADEVKDMGGDGWTRTGTVVSQRLGTLKLGDIPVEITETSRLLIDPVVSQRVKSGGRRLAIDAIIPGTAPLVAFGDYAEGRIVEGRYDRLLVTTAAKEADVLAMLEKTGRVKALVLAIAGLLLLFLTGTSLWATFRRSRPGASK